MAGGLIASEGLDSDEVEVSTGVEQQKTGPGIGADPAAPQVVELNEVPRFFSTAESSAFEKALKKSFVYQTLLKGFSQSVRDQGGIAKPVIRIENQTIHRLAKVVGKNETVYTVTVHRILVAKKQENKLAEDLKLGFTFDDIGLEEVQMGALLKFRLGAKLSAFEVFRVSP